MGLCFKTEAKKYHVLVLFFILNSNKFQAVPHYLAIVLPYTWQGRLVSTRNYYINPLVPNSLLLTKFAES